MLLGKKLLEKIEIERQKFIEQNGNEPDSLYCLAIVENYKGCKFFGMETKINRFLSDDSFIMCKSKDLMDFSAIINRTFKPKKPS